MKKLLILTAIILLFSACRTQQLPPAIHEQSEVVRIEYREFLRDTTIYVQLPVEVIERVTDDTISMVETSLARCVAQLRGGLLWHSIENVAEPFPVEIVYRDREIVRDSIVREFISEPYLVPREFTRWQSYLLVMGQIFFGLLALAFVFSLFLLYRAVKRGLKGN